MTSSQSTTQGVAHVTPSLDDPVGLLLFLGWAKSKSEARRLLQNRALWIQFEGCPRLNFDQFVEGPPTPWPPEGIPCTLWLGKKRHVSARAMP